MASPLPEVHVTEPLMDRGALLLEVGKASSAAALGQSDEDLQRNLDGKPFEVRIRFGCSPNTVRRDRDEGFNVLFGEEDRTLRVRAAPDLTLDDPSIAALASQEAEAVEGFWMHRPWLLTDGCPGTALPLAEAEIRPGADKADTRKLELVRALPTVGNYRVGLAQFYSESDSRTARRDHRAYEVTKVLRENEQPSQQGYNLVLSGRLRKLPTGRVISCLAIRQDAPPECVVSAEFDRVRIEKPGTRDILAEWSS